MSADQPTLGPAFDATLPILPYPDGDRSSSGWSGSTTSHERAVADDSSGTTTERQQRVLSRLALCADDGATWKEVADMFGWHHGQASGVLSNLHQAGYLERLAEVRRHRCAVYVLPQYVNGRATVAYQQKRKQKEQWAVEVRGSRAIVLNEAEARHLASRNPEAKAQRRLVTEWEDA